MHGTLDQPEENSGVLIKRYGDDLGYSVVHEHSDGLGRTTSWQTTYEGLKGIDQGSSPHVGDAHPAEVRLRTVRLRDRDNAWLHVRRASPVRDGLGRRDGAWSERLLRERPAS